MDIKIKMGEYEVLQSGSVIAIEKEPVEFYIEDLIVVLEFKSSEEDTSMKIKSTIADNKKLNLVFWNFDNELGCGIACPVVIGHLKDRELSLLVRFSSLSSGGKEIKYTWLTRNISLNTDEVNNGETCNE